MNKTFSPKLRTFKGTANVSTDKKAVRATVKRVIDLHNQQKISDDVFKSLIEIAMAYEISSRADEKLSSKEKSLDKIFDRG